MFIDGFSRGGSMRVFVRKDVCVIMLWSRKVEWISEGNASPSMSYCCMWSLFGGVHGPV